MRCPSRTATFARASSCALAASGDYRAVVCPTGGRVAPLATWAGARRARVPLILWASLWAHPRSAAHALSYLPLRRLYRSADAVVTYGPHVSAYVRERGARNVYVAPQSVDNAFWSAPDGLASERPELAARDASALPVRRPRGAREGPAGACRRVALGRARAAAGALVARRRRIADLGWIAPAGAAAHGRRRNRGPRPRSSAAQLRDAYAASRRAGAAVDRDANVSRALGPGSERGDEPRPAVIASDAVGAAAGGLVRDGRNGLVVPAGDSGALAGAMQRLAADEALAARLGARAPQDVRDYTHEAWARGFSAALASLGLSREHC